MCFSKNSALHNHYVIPKIWYVFAYSAHLHILTLQIHWWIHSSEDLYVYVLSVCMWCPAFKIIWTLLSDEVYRIHMADQPYDAHERWSEANENLFKCVSTQKVLGRKNFSAWHTLGCYVRSRHLHVMVRKTWTFLEKLCTFFMFKSEKGKIHILTEAVDSQNTQYCFLYVLYWASVYDQYKKGEVSGVKTYDCEARLHMDAHKSSSQSKEWNIFGFEE